MISQKSHNRRAVVYTVDDNLECIGQMLVSIKSVRRIFGSIDIVILTNHPEHDFDGMYGAKVVDVSQIVKRFGLDSTEVKFRKRICSPMLLFRLAIPLVPELSSYDKVLYLDSDTEIWSETAYELFTVDNEGHEVTAVRDSLSNRRVYARMSGVRIRAKCMDPEPFYSRWDAVLQHRGYVNSGVIMFNLDRFRHEGSFEQRFVYIMDRMRNSFPRYPDQDMLNAYFDIFLVLDRRFDDWRRSPAPCFIRHNVGGVRRKTMFYPPEHDARPVSVLDPVPDNRRLGIFSGYTDRIVVISDARDAERSRLFTMLLREVYHVEDFDLVWTFDNVFDRAVLNCNVPVERCVKPEHLHGWESHYRAIRQETILGATRLLVLEDTMELPGAEPVKEWLATLPVDSDLAVFCTKVREHGWHPWSKDSGMKARSSKMYIMSRTCMHYMTWLYESLFSEETVKRKIRYLHHWFGSPLRGKPRIYFLGQEM